MWKYSWIAVAITCLSLAAACGDDGDGEGTPTAPQGAAADGKIGNSDPSTPLDQINEAEWKAACVDMSEAGSTPKLAHGTCIMAGLLSKVIGFDCMDTYNMCLTEPGDLDCEEKPADCAAPLSELDSCHMSQLIWLADQTKDLSCASSANALVEIPEHITPECQALMKKCPSIQLVGSSEDEEF